MQTSLERTPSAGAAADVQQFAPGFSRYEAPFSGLALGAETTLAQSDETKELLRTTDELLATIDEQLGEQALRSVLDAARLSELPEDIKTIERHKQWAAPLVGSLAVGQAVRSPETSQTHETSLAEAIRRVRSGETQFLPMIKANVATAAGENLEKSKYVMDVELEETADGEIIQFGQTMSQIHKNTLLYCDWGQKDMQERTIIESLSAFRTEDRVREGMADSHWLIDVSLIPDLSDDELEKLNFFPRTKTGIIRGFTRREDGKLIYRSAFFSGVADEGAERHDVEAARAVLVEDFGIGEAAEWDINQILESLVAIPKEQLPNGPVDVMSRFDSKIQRNTGRQTYWGQAEPKGDYVSVIRESKDRDEKRRKLIQTITDELIHADDSYDNPLDAVDALQKLVEKHGTVEVIENKAYPTWVFGEKAQSHIEQARQDRQEVSALMAAGRAAEAHQMMQRFELTTERAQALARGGGCPSGMRKEISNDELLPGENAPDGSVPENVNEEGAGLPDDKYGSRTFKCPKKGCRNVRPKNTLIPKCQKCGADVTC